MPNLPISITRMHRHHMISVWFVIAVLTSSAALLTRYCHIPASSIGFWRVLGAALVLLPWWFTAWRRENRPAVFSLGSSLAGVFLGLHFATWAWSLQHTTIANAMLFIGLQPLMAPFIARPLLGERLNRWEKLACLLACFGMVWILGQQLTFGREQLPGSIVALLSAFLCACYFVLARKYRTNQHALLFSLPVYTTAAAVQCVAGVILDGGVFIGDTDTRFALLGLILLPTVGGHTLIIYLLRHVKSQLITLSVPAQFILGTMAAMYLFHEIPSPWFFAGATMVLGGVILGVLKSGQAQTPGSK
ncbi:MAG: DMT family transporter [Victivallales bacterium]